MNIKLMTHNPLHPCKNQTPLNPNEEYVSYDVETLFTNIPVNETINYTISEVYQKNKLPQICCKTIFKRLLK